ncbi:unnamed protein product [Gongylonema pulchrum]|uniref:Uncharacterized protein n=1 Tax=Gongylonema pulchrum TaxID=637853 RepID=A0A183ERP6_9BILA|nr:unnamed protein product [Gongylonema pulchrum]
MYDDVRMEVYSLSMRVDECTLSERMDDGQIYCLLTPTAAAAAHRALIYGPKAIQNVSSNYYTMMISMLSLLATD